MEVSVILATYRCEQILRRTLESFCGLRTEGLQWELFVVDNAGSDATTELARDFDKRLPLQLLIQTTPGKNHALNTAVPVARGELLVFTDNDVIVDPEWLTELVCGAERQPEFDIFAGRILPDFPDGTGLPPDIPHDHFFIRSALGIADWAQDEGPIKAGHVWGANMAVRAHLFREGRSFDTSVGPSPGNSYIPGSETSFTKPAAASGSKCYYLPQALVHHQIRPEQLTLGWIAGRAFRAGRGEATRNFPPAHYLKNVLGIPVFLFKNMAIHLVRGFFSRVLHRRAEHFDHLVNFHMCRGKIFQYYQLSRNHRS